MRVFSARIEGSWAPPIKVQCPSCNRNITFYTNLNGNKCKFCWEVLPFPARMAKDIKLRVEYHVQTEAEEST